MALSRGDTLGSNAILAPSGMGEAVGLTSLSLILCSRNDSYAGNSVWRLQTALNYLARQLDELKLDSVVEVIVTDWGSRIPLRQVLALSAAAAKVTRFLEVPPELAAVLQKDSPFPEVLANNAAIRRARGAYIGRIDQDTLVSRTFFEYFFSSLANANEAAVMFGGRRSIPIEVARRCPPFEKVVRYADRFGRYLPPEGKGRKPWFDAPTGIFLMHRDLWWEAFGYNEQFLYWGFMEAEVIQRLATKYPIVDLSQNGKCEFYHLSHSTLRFSITPRRKNARLVSDLVEPHEEWGLAAHEFPLQSAEPSDAYSQSPSGQTTSWIVDLASWLKEWFWQAVLILPRLAYNAVRHKKERKEWSRSAG